MVTVCPMRRKVKTLLFPENVVSLIDREGEQAAKKAIRKNGWCLVPKKPITVKGDEHGIFIFFLDLDDMLGMLLGDSFCFYPSWPPDCVKDGMVQFRIIGKRKWKRFLKKCLDIAIRDVARFKDSITIESAESIRIQEVEDGCDS